MLYSYLPRSWEARKTGLAQSLYCLLCKEVVFTGSAYLVCYKSTNEIRESPQAFAFKQVHCIHPVAHGHPVPCPDGVI